MQYEVEIRAGDVVVVDDGWPVMTVRSRSLNLAYCTWVEEGKEFAGNFQVSGLQLVQAADASAATNPSHGASVDVEEK